MSQSVSSLAGGAAALGRPAVHLTPPTGWMNDPNGLLLHEGRLHVFYQYEPDAPRWGRMRWGHAVSSDLVSWEHLPIALEPDVGGPDAFGCWSGCVVRNDRGVPTLLYTAVRLEQEHRQASICLATGDSDLRAWKKRTAPLIAAAPPGFRPDMFRDPFAWNRGADWALLVGAGTVAARGAVLLYSSPDLERWTYGGPFLTTEQLIDACPELDVAEIDSACWECPQLVQFPDGRSMLIVSIVDRSPAVRPAHVVAIVGRVVGDRFLPERAERLGLGPDFYAPATAMLPDGRALLFGWVPEDPPADHEDRTWAGALTLPRVISIDGQGAPTIDIAPEVAAIGRTTASWASIVVRDDRPWTIETDAHVELRLDLRPEGAAAIRIDVEAGDELIAEIRFDPRSRRLMATRITRVLVAGLTPHGMATLPPSASQQLSLRIILDGSILELVADDRVTATVRLPSIAGGRTISLTTFGGSCRIVSAELRCLLPAVA